MKIAYCISGHVREFYQEVSVPTKEVIAAGADLFVSTWNRSGYRRSFWQGDKEDDTIVDKTVIEQLYNPVTIDVEDRDSYNYLNHYDKKLGVGSQYVNTLNTLLMFKKIKKCIDYVTEDYNIVIRSRFDLHQLRFNLGHTCEPGVIYGKLSPINGMPSDIFFYGDYVTMKKCVPDETFYTDDVVGNARMAEEIFKWYLQSQNIEFRINSQLSYSLTNLKQVIY